MNLLPPDAQLPESPRKRFGCGAGLAVVGVAGALLLGFVFWKGSDMLSRATGGVFSFLGALPGKFQTQNITRTFRESLVSVTPTNGDILEVATLEMNEVLADVDIKTLGNLIYLGTTVSEIQVPVVYRYHIKLTDEWKLSVDGNVCTVVAPQIRPSLPPAIRTDGMSRKSEAGWLRFNAASNLAELERNLTPMIERRAATQRRINQVKDASRKAVAEFVRTWLLKEQQWRSEGISAIIVRFPGDENPAELKPTVALP
ncbi:MAG: hypothetical protein JNJ83_14065 [Verrucomicrobiaceae bacterium]|nr:hypothetical protein [Verrucomicrobiaceae bacterium]